LDVVADLVAGFVGSPAVQRELVGGGAVAAAGADLLAVSVEAVLEGVGFHRHLDWHFAIAHAFASFESLNYDSIVSLAEIKSAVRELPPSELAKLAAFIADEYNAAWDKQMDEDSASGKLSRFCESKLLPSFAAS
jgi:hypothetical protein